MADIVSKEVRSKMMSKVSQKDTPQELIVRRFLFSKGLRYRKNYKALPGSPDVVIHKYKSVVFIHGCFWHGHSCKAGGLPKSNSEFWKKKIDSNQSRDESKNEQLRQLGWKVLTIWQCDLTKNKQATTLEALYDTIVK